LKKRKSKNQLLQLFHENIVYRIYEIGIEVNKGKIKIKIRELGLNF